MNYPRIEIHELGPLTNVELTLRDFMVFIGPQASGKSTLAKVVYFFHSFPDILHRFVSSSMFSTGVEDYSEYSLVSIRSEICKYWYACVGYRGDVLLYWKENYSVKISKEGCDFSFDLSGDIMNHCNAVTRYLSVLGDIKAWNELEIMNKLYSDFRKMFSMSDEFVIIPTERVKVYDAVTLQGLSVEETNFYYFVKRLREGYNEIIVSNERRKLAITLANKILRGTLLPRKEGDLLSILAGGSGSTPQEITLPLSTASSGQRDAAWLVEVAKSFILREKRNVSLIVEEPEGHLFPEGQKAMAELLGLFFNGTGNQVLMTTHSPYMISALNNLIYAKDVADAGKNNGAEKIIHPHLWIDGSRVGAYLLKDGHAHCIIDPDLGDINVDPIHEVMNQIDGEYRQLLDQEFDQ